MPINDVAVQQANAASLPARQHNPEVGFPDWALQNAFFAAQRNTLYWAGVRHRWAVEILKKETFF
jgi:hypothetical protein